MSITYSNSPFQQLDLSLLKYFSVVASYSGYSKASRATGVSQPALSLGVQKLEKAINMPLIERESGLFQLTPAGVKLFSFCQKLEGNLETVVSDLGLNSKPATRRYRIGTAYSIGSLPLVSMCEAASEAQQKLEFELKNQSSFQLLADLNAGLLDAAIVPDEVNNPSLKLKRLYEDQMVFVYGIQHKGLFRKFPWREAIKQIALVNYTRESPTRYLIDHICAKERLSFRNIISVDGVDALRSLISGGVGGGFMMKSLIGEEINADLLVETEKLPFSPPKRSYG